MRTRGGARQAGPAILVAALALGFAPTRIDAAVAPAIAAIAVGYSDTCALTTAGGVKCWGYGLHGELGTGTSTTSLTPTGVVGLASGVRAIASGTMFGCALTGEGGVRCWGWNRSGQLGDGTTTTSAVPVDVVGLDHGITAIAAGGAQACALTSAGGVKCWGVNLGGQPGNGSTSNSSTPVDVSGLSTGVTAIASGGGHTCALTSGGVVRCWGFNGYGQLGDGTTRSSGTPVAVIGLPSDVTALTAGSGHTCAVASRGTVMCWGWNIFGQLGNGTKVSSSVPVQVFGLTGGATAIAAGANHTCALTNAGGITCWGFNRYSGQLGDGTTTTSSVPVDVVGLARGMTAISAGGQHTCGLTVRGTVKCWGDNSYGQLGNGTRTISRVPVDVDFATHQAIDLRGSAPPGALPTGTTVTFQAQIAPLGPVAERVVVRFEIYRRDGGVWHRAATRDVSAAASGLAILRWTFATSGSRYARARALATPTYAESAWSSPVHYRVE